MRKRRPPYAPGRIRTWNPVARWLLFFAIGAALGLIFLLVTAAAHAGDPPYPGPVVTPSTYGPPGPSGGPLPAVLFVPVLAAYLRRRLEHPDPDGHGCGYCEAPARYGVRLYRHGSVVWQLLTTKPHWCCNIHYPLAVGDAHRALHR